MAFTQKTFTLSHVITKEVAANQAIMIPVDLSDLITADSRSTLFTVDGVSLTAYKRGTCERIPVKYAALNAGSTRVISHDVFKLSSPWPVDNPRLSAIQIAGTDTEPYARTLCVHDKRARVAMLNLLGFAMTSGLWGLRNIKRGLDDILTSRATEFAYVCKKCFNQTALTVDRNTTLFKIPLCHKDNQPCTPSPPAAGDETTTYSAVYRLISAFISAANNTMPGLDQLTRRWVNHLVPAHCTECDTFPPRNPYAIVVPLDLLQRFAGLYDTMCAGVDSFAVVDSSSPRIRLIVESPSRDIGLLTGSIRITMIYGHCLAGIHEGLARNVGPEDEDFEPTDISQMTNDVILKSVPGVFVPTINVSLEEWCVCHHDRYKDGDLF